MTIQYAVSPDGSGWKSVEVEARAASVPERGLQQVVAVVQLLHVTEPTKIGLMKKEIYLPCQRVLTLVIQSVIPPGALWRVPTCEPLIKSVDIDAGVTSGQTQDLSSLVLGDNEIRSMYAPSALNQF
jgi:hypothetical protein